MRPGILFLFILLFIIPRASYAGSRVSSFSLYSGELTGNHFEEFLKPKQLEYKSSYLLAIALAHRVGQWQDKLSYEVEGQVVRHFHLQNHWEFNLLGVLRWEKFFWDHWCDTSMAFGLGGSYATDKPEIEIENDGETGRFLIYWMLELAVVPFRSQARWELIARVHHRSDAFGLIADDGGSNAMAFGLRYRY